MKGKGSQAKSKSEQRLPSEGYMVGMEMEALQVWVNPQRVMCTGLH